MSIRRPISWLAFLVSLMPAFAAGGLLTSPAPDFDGVPGRVVYRMGPVHHEQGHVDTLVICTNLGDVGAGLAIEIFDSDDALAGLLTRAKVAAGGTVTFATAGDVAPADAVVVLALPPMENAKARVSATTARLSCSAKHVLRAAGGGSKEVPLELVKKVAGGD